MSATFGPYPTELGQLLIGVDALAVERDWQLLQRRFWRGGVVLQTAIGALDQALWDIRGKAWGDPAAYSAGRLATDCASTPMPRSTNRN